MATLNENIPFLYGELNKTTEYLRYKSKTLNIVNSATDYSIELNPNTLVTLKRIKVDSNIEDDTIKHYGLFAYNPSNSQFDIQLGDTITVGSNPGASTSIYEVLINGQSIPFRFSDGGQLILEYIPVNAIKDVENSFEITEDGEVIYYESVIDGNIL